MEAKEHYLMLLMFGRVQECLQVITDTLKSRNLWADDDQMAFGAAVHLDEEKIRKCLRMAQQDYFRIAKSLGVVTGLEGGFPE